MLYFFLGRCSGSGPFSIPFPLHFAERTLDNVAMLLTPNDWYITNQLFLIFVVARSFHYALSHSRYQVVAICSLGTSELFGKFLSSVSHAEFVLRGWVTDKSTSTTSFHILMGHAWKSWLNLQEFDKRSHLQRERHHWKKKKDQNNRVLHS